MNIFSILKEARYKGKTIVVLSSKSSTEKSKKRPKLEDKNKDSENSECSPLVRLKPRMMKKI